MVPNTANNHAAQPFDSAKQQTLWERRGAGGVGAGGAHSSHGKIVSPSAREAQSAGVPHVAGLDKSVQRMVVGAPPITIASTHAFQTSCHPSLTQHACCRKAPRCRPQSVPARTNNCPAAPLWKPQLDDTDEPMKVRRSTQRARSPRGRHQRSLVHTRNAVTHKDRQHRQEIRRTKAAAGISFRAAAMEARGRTWWSPSYSPFENATAILTFTPRSAR